jgi:hypothetical protein
MRRSSPECGLSLRLSPHIAFKLNPCQPPPGRHGLAPLKSGNSSGLVLARFLSHEPFQLHRVVRRERCIPLAEQNLSRGIANFNPERAAFGRALPRRGDPRDSQGADDSRIEIAESRKTGKRSTAL